MSINTIIKSLTEAGKSFTNYDVLFLARKTHPRTGIQEVRAQIALQLPPDYHTTVTRIGGKSARLHHPAQASPDAYDPNTLANWTLTRYTDRDGRLSIPKPMVANLPTGTALGTEITPGTITISKKGTPNKRVKIQPRRLDLRINPILLAEAGMSTNRYQIQKTTRGIKISPADAGS